MRLDWLPAAERNVEDQVAYIAARNPKAALAMGDKIEAAVARLADHPHMGRPGRLRGTRELVVTGTPYVVVYRVEPAAVVILRVLHGAQRWPPRL
ncbi:MAG TPA: type II toxin-antitoxin system RelE/ParE family toxin [Vineibacter sp.]|nr:type II toxin-antitoxin system RelE/ParE family toxin [Vineibacter sp.]